MATRHRHRRCSPSSTPAGTGGTGRKPGSNYGRTASWRQGRGRTWPNTATAEQVRIVGRAGALGVNVYAAQGRGPVYPAGAPWGSCFAPQLHRDEVHHAALRKEIMRTAWIYQGTSPHRRRRVVAVYPPDLQLQPTCRGSAAAGGRGTPWWSMLRTASMRSPLSALRRCARSVAGRGGWLRTFARGAGPLGVVPLEGGPRRPPRAHRRPAVLAGDEGRTT